MRRGLVALLVLGVLTACGFRDDLRNPTGLVVESVTVGQADAVQGEAGIALTIRVRNDSSVRETLALPALSVSIAGTDASASFVPTASGGNAQHVEARASVDLAYTLLVAEASPAGVASLNATVASRDGVVQSGPAPSPASLLVLRHAQLEVLTQSVDGASCRDSRVATFRVRVRNTGESTAVLDAVLPVIERGGVDVTSELQVSASAGNATTLAPAAEADLDFLLASTAATGLGPVTAELPLTAHDERSDVDASPALVAPVALTIHEPAALSLTAITETRVNVSKGQTGIAVQASLANAGTVPAALTAGSLLFSIGGNGTSADYSVPAPVLGTVSSAGVLTIDFTVAVGAAAQSGATVVDATFAADDVTCGEVPSATNATAKGAWTVQTPPILSAAVTASAENVWAGDSGSLTLVITNSGEATANAVAPSMTISSCPTCATLTAVDVTPKTIAAGANATYTWNAAYSVPVAANVVTPTFDGGGTGTDANTGGTVSSSSNSDATTVEARLPVPCFTFNPAAVTKSVAGNDIFTVDASCSSDVETPDGGLDFDWDWDDDGSFDTFNAVTTTRNYSNAARHNAVVRVTDPQGRRAYKTRILVVETNSDYGCVTTTVDELNPNDASVSNGNIAPYDGTGFSFREAITWTGPHGGQSTICISAALAGQTITFNPALGNLPNVDNDTIIAGRLDVTIDFTGLTRGILTGFDSELYNLRLTGGTGPKVILSENAVRVDGCEIFGGTGPGIAWVQGTSTVTNNMAIFGNDIHDNPGGGIVITPTNGGDVDNGDIQFNRVYDNGTVGIRVEANDNLVIGRNLVYGNAGDGMVIGMDDGFVVNNTIVLNTGDGLELRSCTLCGDATGAQYWNNLIFDNGGYGINAMAGVGADSDTGNFVFGNDLGETLGAAADLGLEVQDEVGTLNPLLEADFELAQNSPCRNAGFDTGSSTTPDSNDTETGRFRGTAQDVGWWESPR